jgi:hypothetical protein
MATVIRTSPKKTEAKEKAKGNVEHYSIKTADFALKLKEYASYQANLFTLTKNLYSLGKGVHLEYDLAEQPGVVVTVRRRDLRSLESKLTKHLMELKKYFRWSMKKSRSPPQPWSFKGIYTPVLAGTALSRFFTNEDANYGPVSPIYEEFVAQGQTEKANSFLRYVKERAVSGKAALAAADQQYPVDLAAANGDKLKLVQAEKDYYLRRKEYDDNINLISAYDQAASQGGSDQALHDWLLQPLKTFLAVLTANGYLLRNTITMLFFIYIHANNLQNGENAQYTRSDAVMTDAFNNAQYPAVYYVQKGLPKQPMDQIAPEGRKTTYAMIAENNPPYVKKDPKSGKESDEGFKESKFKTFFFQNIAAANYVSKSAALQADQDNLSRADVKEAMLTEHNFVKAVSQEWSVRLEPLRDAQKELKKKAKAKTA